MQRTTIVLPPQLKELASTHARAAGISFGEFVRRAVQRAIAEGAPRENRRRDPFLADRAVYRGDVPRDLARNPDHYLYGDE